MSLPSFGPIADVTAYGADPTGKADSIDAFEAARDALLARGGVPPGRPNPASNRGRIWCPAGFYRLSRPFLLCADYVELAGDGDLTTLFGADYGPVLWLDRDIPIPDGVQPDSYGILDASVAPAPGVARGLATKAPGDVRPSYFLTAPGSPPSLLPDGGWQSRKILTVDACFASVPAPGAWFGLGDPIEPSPFYVSRWLNPSTGVDGLTVWFHTAEGRYKVPADPPRFFQFGALNRVAAGPLRISFTIDLTRASIRGWVNGREQIVVRDYGTRLTADSQVESAFIPGLHFAPNKMGNFHVGNGSWHDGDYGAAPRLDLAVHGLCIASDAPYTSDAAGSQQRRDGAPIDDAYRYAAAGGRDRSAVVALMNTDAKLPTGRLLRLWSGCATGYTPTAIVQREHGDAGATPVQGVTVRDLRIWQLPLNGQGVLLGPTTGGFRMVNVAVGNGRRGVVGLNVGATYDLEFLGCDLAGADAWLQLTAAVARVDRLPRNYVGGAAIRAMGCDLAVGSLQTSDMAPGGRAVEVLADGEGGDFAASYQFGRVNVDRESNTGPAPVYVEKQGVDTTLILSNLTAAGLAPGAAAVELVDRFPGLCAARAVLSGIQSGGNPPCVAGGDWRLNLEGIIKVP